MNKNERLNELLMDKDFQQKSLAVSTQEEVQSLFAEFGLELTAEEVEQFLIQLGQMLSETQSEELNEDDLDNVSGGAWSIVLTGAAASAFGIACGVTIGIGAVALGGYIIYKQATKKKK